LLIVSLIIFSISSSPDRYHLSNQFKVIYFYEFRNGSWLSSQFGDWTRYDPTDSALYLCWSASLLFNIHVFSSYFFKWLENKIRQISIFSHFDSFLGNCNLLPSLLHFKDLICIIFYIVYCILYNWKFIYLFDYCK
jgi:hypothetical protein